MRPSEDRNIAVVLDTLAECKVVHDALTDFSQPQHNPAPEDFSDTLRARFVAQTRVQNYDSGYAHVSSEWRLQSEFRVMQSDIGYVRAAAARTIAETGLAHKTFNRVTGRTQAARLILRSLSANIPAGQAS